MKFIIKIIALFAFLLFVNAGYAQRKDLKVVQLTGAVVDNEDLSAIAYVHISVKGTGRGTVCDGNGFFSIVVMTGEQLVFSRMGYHPVTFKVPDTVLVDRYSLYQSLTKDTFELPVVVIYPWPSKEKFREAFINLKIPDDDYEIARKNTILAEMREKMRESPMGSGANYKNYMSQQTAKLYYAGQLSQPNNLLNPFAWSQFLQIWNQQKEAKRKEKLAND